MECFLPDPNFSSVSAIPPSPAVGMRAVKIKILSSNFSLPGEYSPKLLSWTVSWVCLSPSESYRQGRSLQGLPFCEGLFLSPALQIKSSFHHCILGTATYGQVTGYWQLVSEAAGRRAGPCHCHGASLADNSFWGVA